MALTAITLSDIMKEQTQVWADTLNADELLIDICHTLAKHLELTGNDKDQFMGACGLTLAWTVAR